MKGIGGEDPERAARLVPDAMLEALSAAGAPAVAARVDELRSLGVGLPVLAPLTTRADTVDTWRAVELI